MLVENDASNGTTIRFSYDDIKTIEDVVDPISLSAIVKWTCDGPICSPDKVIATENIQFKDINFDSGDGLLISSIIHKYKTYFAFDVI